MDLLGDIRHDWYQTDCYVVISVLLKKMKQEDVRVDWTESTLTCVVNIPDGKQCSFHINLAHQICKDGCTWKVLPSKIEIKLKKSSAIRWETLKAENSVQKPKEFVSYPSSNKEKRDWDKLAQQVAKEEEDEKLEGDAALNQMFQKIYSEGSDETRKAMNKSFLESGGTVLSTNWNEVHSKKMEIKPPDGMEWKRWDS